MNAAGDSPWNFALHRDCAADLDGLCRLAAETGVHRLVLSLASTGADLSPNEPPSVTTELGKRLTGENLLPAALHVVDASIDFTHADRQRRERAAELMKSSLDVAASLHCTTLLLHPCGAANEGPSAAYEDAYTWLLESLLEQRQAAQQSGVLLALVNPNRFLLSPLEMRSLIDEVNSASVCVAFRPNIAVRFARSGDWFRTLGHRISTVMIEAGSPPAEAVPSLHELLPAPPPGSDPSRRALVSLRFPGASPSFIRQVLSSAAGMQASV